MIVTGPSSDESSTSSALGKGLFVALLLISMGMLVWNLNQRPLWADEAETALLARNILSEGVPCIEEGQSWVYPRIMGWVNGDDVWIWSPWLDEYVAAVSFAVAGESEWSARFPFVLFGIMMFLLAGWLVKRLTGDWLSASATLILLLGSPTILHHIRQCRYYSLSMLAVIALAWGWMRWKEGRRGGGAILTSGIFVLFMTLPTIAAASMMALAVHAILFAGSARGAMTVLGWTAFGGALALPWYLWARPVGQMSTIMSVGYLGRFSGYLLEADAHFVPLGVMGFALFIWLSKAGWRASAGINAILWLLGMIFLFNLLLISSIGYEAFRYLVPTAAIPAVVILLLLRGIGCPGTVMIVISSILALTNGLSIQAWQGQSPARILGFVSEVKSAYEEDVRIVAELIEQWGEPNDRVMVVDEELSLAFLLGNRLELGLDPASLKVDSLVGLWDHINRHPVVAVMPRVDERLPEWIVSRSLGRSIVGRHELQMPHGWARLYEERVVDIPAQRNDGSDPDPKFYQRSMTEERVKLTIYRRRALSAEDASRKKIDR